MYVDRYMDSYPRRMRPMHSRRIPDSYDMWPCGGNYVHPVPFHGYLDHGYLPDIYSSRPQYPRSPPQPYPLNYHGVYPKVHEPYDHEYGPRQVYSEQPRKEYEDNAAGNYHYCACPKPEHRRSNGNTNYEIEDQNPKLSLKSCEQWKPFESNVGDRNEAPPQKKIRNQESMSPPSTIGTLSEENIQKSEMGTRKWRSPSNDGNENILGVVEDNVNRKSIPVMQNEPQEVLKVGEKSSLDDEAAAVIIQCAYRGYMVRKWELLKKLRQIVKIREQVGDVAKSIQALQSSSDDMKDEKQRLIIEESIMRLLLKLDTVQGMPPNYKDVRKSVVRELTKMQEILDALTDNASEDQNGKKVSDSDPQLDRDQVMEETPVESGNTFQHNEISLASPVLSTNDGAFIRKLMEENAMLKEQMGKLIEEGKEKTRLIHNLSKRLEILEHTSRQLCGHVFPF